MEICLFSEDGYYSKYSADIKYSSNFLDFFAKAFVISVEEMLRYCDASNIYDFGITDAGFIRRVLKFFPSKINYFLVESDLLRYRRGEFPKEVNFIRDHELGSDLNGVMISNKIVDSMPFHLIVYQDGFKEVYVDYRDGKFKEVLIDLKNPEIEKYLENLNMEITNGQRLEVCLEALKFIQFMGDKLSNGFVITSGYLSTPEELYTRDKFSGTLTCYKYNFHTHNPFLVPGEMDIKASVDVLKILEYGESSGLRLTGLTNHLHLMKSVFGVIDEFIDDIEKISGAKYRDSKLGSVKILIQHKGVRNPVLKCLKIVPDFSFWEKYNYPYMREAEVLPEG
jgi:SAM-dependent MidA family methyltransferase